MKKYKETFANILDTADFITRLMAGETFYSRVLTTTGVESLAEMFYDCTAPYPFRSVIIKGTQDVDLPKEMWRLVKEFKLRTELSWEDTVSVSDPTLCWVSNDYASEKALAVWIQKIDTCKETSEYIYTAAGTSLENNEEVEYSYATPVNSSFCHNG